MERLQHRSAPDDIDITSLGRAVGRNFKKVLLATALAGGASFAVLSLMSPRFASEARILIDNDVPESMKPIGSSDRAEGIKPDKETVTSQVEVIKSKEISVRVAEKLKLFQNPEFNSALKGNDPIGAVVAALGFGPSQNESEEQRVLNTIYKNLQVFNVKDSRVIAVEFRASDSKLAADGANAIADVYIERQKIERMKVDQGAVQVISVEIPKLTAELRDAENELEKFKAVTGQLPSSTGTTGTATLNTQQMSEINTKLSDARSQRSDAEARAKTIRAMMTAAGQVDASPDVLKSPVIQQLQVQKSRLDRQMSELSATLLPAHPRIQQLKAEQSGFGKQMRDEALKIVVSLENEAKIASAREATLKSEFDRMMQNTGRSSGNFAKLRELEGVVKSKREVLDAYVKRDRDQRTRGVTTAVPANASIYSRASESSTPVFPKTGPITLLVMAATFLGGLAMVLTKALLFGSAAPDAAARPRGRGPASGSSASSAGSGSMTGGGGRLEPVPLAASAWAASSGGSDPATMSGLSRSIAEPSEARTSPSPAQHMGSLDAIAKHLLMRASDQPGYRTLITGDDDGLEFAADAVELGKALGAAGKNVVLVDWSIAAKSISSILSIPRTPGIRELISGEASFDAVVHRVNGFELQAIAPGKPRPETESPEEIESIHLVFEALDETYDHILIVAEQAVARRLFGLLDGGFDAGLLVGKSGQVPSDHVEGGFLGFSVPELDVLRYAPTSAATRAIYRLPFARNGSPASPH